MRKILIVDDDPEILELVKCFLEGHQITVVTLPEGRKAIETILQFEPDLIILDINMPDVNGMDLLKIFKDRPMTSFIPVIMLTGKSAPSSQVSGLVSGADDYVTKPFSLPELLARVRALLRRRPGEETEKVSPDSIQLGNIFLDFKKYKALKEGLPLSLSPKEFGVLRYLATRAGDVVTRDELLDEVWGYEKYPTTRTVDNHIAQLRSKIEENPSDPQYLITVHGVGYKLVLDEEKT
ncbi:response regulator transcription factor [bacterium]|nr:response regulator transcription factor [bacterium]